MESEKTEDEETGRDYDPSRRGFAVVMRPHTWYADFERRARTFEFEHGWGEGWEDYRQQLRSAFPAVDPRRHRGFARSPLECWDDGCDQLARAGLIDEREIHAQRLMESVLGPFRQSVAVEDGSDLVLLPRAELGAQVVAATDLPSDWEVVFLERGATRRNPNTLGFDIGWWRGPYSILGDVLLAPQWHPAPEDAFDALRDFAARLNEHMLFESADDALAYRAWYVEQGWAETEDSPFEAIRVDQV